MSEDHSLTNIIYIQISSVIILFWVQICGRAGSFSDSCAALVIVNFQNFYVTMNEQFKPHGFCHLAGVCVDRYHVHEDRVSKS